MLSSVGLGGGVVGESVSISRFSLGSYPRSGWGGGGVVGKSVSISRFSLGCYPRSGWGVGWWVSLSVFQGSA